MSKINSFYSPNSPHEKKNSLQDEDKFNFY